MNARPDYLIYPSLLDAYQNCVSGSELYGEFYGFSEDPKISEEDFVEKQRLSLIDRINRVPVPWEDTGKMDAGTAFNEVVDCIVLNKKSDRMEMESRSESGTVTVRYNGRTFIFPVSLCREFAAYYRGAIPQVYTEAILPTQYGNVLMYGYIDILMPSSVHDIKTTSKYSAGKYRRNWQHIVYPYCLNQSGNSVRDFEYNIAVLTGAVGTYTEYYGYTPERDVPRLTECV
ncbi:MAG: HNH endonuclease [Tannerella sp.]|jgi:hypothetical protein|nr:HNH endonuclease [Tannerella sp.]